MKIFFIRYFILPRSTYVAGILNFIREKKTLSSLARSCKQLQVSYLAIAVKLRIVSNLLQYIIIYIYVYINVIKANKVCLIFYSTNRRWC